MKCEKCEFREDVPKMHGASRCSLTFNIVGDGDACELPDEIRLPLVARRMVSQLEMDDIDAQSFDETIYDVLSKQAFDINDQGLLSQVEALFEMLGEGAVDVIFEVLGKRADKINAETDRLGLLGTRDEYDDAIGAVDDAIGTDTEHDDPGMHKAKELLEKAREREYDE